MRGHGDSLFHVRVSCQDAKSYRSLLSVAECDCVCFGKRSEGGCLCVCVCICVWEVKGRVDFFLGGFPGLICEGKAPRRGDRRVILILSTFLESTEHTYTHAHMRIFTTSTPPSHDPSGSELRWMMLSGDSGVEGSGELVRDPSRVVICIRTGELWSSQAPCELFAALSTS